MAAHLLLAVAAVAALLSVPAGRYAIYERRHRRHQRHLAAVRIEPVRPGEGDPRCGSMQLDDEMTLYGPPDGGSSCSFLPAAPDWRDQTMAELSPEALAVHHDDFPQGPEAAASWGDCSGPGAPSQVSAPGPAEMSESVPTAPRRAEPWPKDTGASGGWGWALTGAHAPVSALERLADTGDIASARLLAEWDAELRAQDDDAAAFLARLGFEAERVRLSVAEAWA